MTLDSTVPAFKVALLDTYRTHTTLGEDERPDLLYAPPLDVKGRFVQLGMVNEDVSPDDGQMRREPSLLRYTLDRTWDWICCSGETRDPWMADLSAYELVEDLLSVFVRGDENGQSYLTRFVPSVEMVEYSSAHPSRGWADDSDDLPRGMTMVTLSMTATMRRT